MIDKRLENNIKKTRDFIEIWEKFHALFHKALSDKSRQRDEEANFLSTKTLVNSRYDDLMDSLGKKPIERFIKSESIYNILSIKELSIMSDEKINTVDKDWNESYKFLKALLDRLTRKKRRIQGFNRFTFFVKKGINRFK